uniref:protein-tyrosine-phosphatase n=1 Tax=Kwoniella dejecticola CBS 10117 TaxID=1296121 RepID=A0A1A6A510_9TREE|nr:uncharacterized protein I303_04444 [Kwoniella dejecticola CBS 10117]OBR85113.1 hypothetical protein I303_04444 [Kwoniella dejecticola CBS 10117]
MNHHVESEGRSTGSSSNQGTNVTPPTSAFEFSFPPVHQTPDRRRQAPPSSIPNFPNSHEPRNPPPTIPFSPSPTQSPMVSSPFRSPDPPIAESSTRPGFSLPVSQPFGTPSAGSGVSSPWHALAATSGAPTPSLESGPMGRSSPHLGYPFERLNIGGSWSGANLWGDGAQDRRGSADSSGMSGGLGSSPGKGSSELSSPPPVNLPPPGPVRGLSAETLLRYKAMSTSASGSLNTPMTKAASQGGIAELSASSYKASSNDSATPPPPLPPALARRRGSLPKASLGAPSLSLPPSRPGKSPSPLASNSTNSSPGTGTGTSGKRLQPITAKSLIPLIASPSTLILDVRPPSSFHDSHIPTSHSLPIPSTLLRRPAFNIEKLAGMLQPKSSEAVLRWREKGDIVLLDADSGSVGQGSVLDGLSSKFEREGYAGHLWYVKGGHSALTQGDVQMTAQGDEERPVSGTTLNKGLLAGQLGTLAFKQESTGASSNERRPPPAGVSPTPGFSLQSNPFNLAMPSTQTSAATERPGSRSGHKLTLSGMPSPKKAKFQPANPFFDNIRQNLELLHGGITERIPLNLPEQVMSRVEDLPDFLKDLATMPEKESMDQLAKQFYDLELNEQKRLQAVMKWHSQGSGGLLSDQAGKETTIQEDYFPFSITAGVERGTKNRYKNIWPYDFSRVRLEQPPDCDSDYINASYVHPRGTSRRYIATQGPLDATYQDFWTLVWEQGVRVIVMITKQYEGGLIKCGNYWESTTYGNLQLQMVSQSGGEDHGYQQPTTGFDFGPAAVTPRSSSFPTGKEKNIKRVFKLTNLDQPTEPSRTVIQVQCIGWPDFDVPETPETLYNLIKDVDAAVDESDCTGPAHGSERPPVLVHCSAGVGRTGSFIVIDAILDALRREIRHGSDVAASPTDADQVTAGNSLSPTSSAIHIPNKSADPGKAVSFLSPPSGGASIADDIQQELFTTSPNPISSSSTSPAPQSSRPLTAAALAENNADQVKAGETDTEMDVDETPSDLPPERFFKHRGSISTDISSETGVDTRRPSLASTKHSSDFLPLEARLARTAAASDTEHNAPMPIIRSGTKPRAPSPISEMEHPVASVLEGMRVQRMSLVQTLRQYLFVHRAIIHNYLHILDEEKSNSASGATSRSRSRSRSKSLSNGLSGTSLDTTKSNSTIGSTGTVGTAATDDEAHMKRRASPTELEVEKPHPELASSPLIRHLDDSSMGSGTSLTKRPSFKKMRPAIDSLATPSSAGSGNSANSANSANSLSSNSNSISSAGSDNNTSALLTSPQKKGRLRSRSKLAMDDKAAKTFELALPSDTSAHPNVNNNEKP